MASSLVGEEKGASEEAAASCNFDLPSVAEVSDYYSASQGESPVSLVRCTVIDHTHFLCD